MDNPPSQVVDGVTLCVACGLPVTAAAGYQESLTPTDSGVVSEVWHRACVPAPTPDRGSHAGGPVLDELAEQARRWALHGEIQCQSCGGTVYREDAHHETFSLVDTDDPQSGGWYRVWHAACTPDDPDHDTLIE